MAGKKKTATLPQESPKKTPTVSQPEGAVAPVTNPLDLWYLCEKVNYAIKNPKKRSDGQMMYQRVVTQLIRKDDRAFNYHFPYIGEVGYDMTQSPPKPIMSRRNPNWPSTFPLSKFHAIKKGYGYRLRGLGLSDVEVQRILELLTSGELESLLSPEMRQQHGAAKPLPNELEQLIKGQKGLFRIPDVVRIKNIMLAGKLAFSQENIHTVIEIKFPGDRLTPEQRVAYVDIAGGRMKFRLLETGVCQVDDKRKREWIRDAKKEPVYVPVGLAGARMNSDESQCLRPDVVAYPLLEGDIEQEFQQVQQFLAPHQPARQSGPRFEPVDPAVRIAQERELEKARGKLGAILGAPLFVAGSGAALATAATTTTTAVTGAVAEVEVLIGYIGGQVVRYARTIGTGVAVGSSAAGTYATAEPHPVEPQPVGPKIKPEYEGLSRTMKFLNDPLQPSQDYIYWPD
ncbi:VRR-NUC domain-containing protein [Xenorhabdus szentirmaii]|uniref:VRR-NUC domain-containing protein n=1 Tax=Xenorhabdus szentirmaii TaxID=290112 RepID=UPI0019904298|nr:MULTISPECIES: VRR-NUC domain-containing protein [unclassified Xenorhabdus]MBD2792534.1 VRR-NUC domain-containing protein [Xenorhabdus sp. CUL]MBD2823542.1 VRR-NUC domain-containing protein [Xenorhabdus sp. 5]